MNSSQIRWKKLGLCAQCVAKPLASKPRLCERCKIKSHEHEKKYTREIKSLAFNQYGGALCACCGETEFNFLSLDHIEGKGNEHRRQLKSRGGSQFYTKLKLLNWPSGFQVLCMNCNWGKRMNNVCPHKQRLLVAS